MTYSSSSPGPTWSAFLTPLGKVVCDNLPRAARDRLSVRGWDVDDVFITSIQDVVQGRRRQRRRPALAEQKVGRNAEQVAERANLGHRQRTLSGEELRYSRFSTENGRELRTGHLVLAEHEIDHTLWGATVFVDRVVLVLVGFHKNGQELESTTGSRRINWSASLLRSP